MIRMSKAPPFLILLAVFPLGMAVAQSTEQQKSEQLELWNDPGFQKRFMDTFVANADIEPKLTTVEREILELRILPLLSEDSDAAIQALREVMSPQGKKGRPAVESAFFDFTLGNLLFQDGKLEEAAPHYETAIEKFGSFRRAYKNLGLIRVRLGEFEKAIPLLSQVIELGGGDGLSYGLLGYSYSSMGDYVPAESAYRSAMLLEPATLDWKLGLTQSVLKQRKYGEAVMLCEELISRDLERSDFWLLQANAYIGMDQPFKAAENFEIVNRMGQATVQSLNTLGDIYVNETLWDLAARAYGQAVSMDLGQPVTRPLRSVEVLARRGAGDQARELLATVQDAYEGRLDEEERIQLLRLQARLDAAEGEGDSAVQVLGEIVKLDPLDGEALLLLGQHYARTDQPEQAIFYYERVQSIGEFEADARVRHAQVLVSQSRYEEAVPLLKRAQELKPRDDVARYLEQVERVARSRRSM
jgi:tetratricopeptide (TPR) repeat protein